MCCEFRRVAYSSTSSHVTRHDTIQPAHLKTHQMFGTTTTQAIQKLFGARGGIRTHTSQDRLKGV